MHAADTMQMYFMIHVDLLNSVFENVQQAVHHTCFAESLTGFVEVPKQNCF